MIQIGEIIEPDGDPPHLWPLLRQVGIERVVTLLAAGEQRRRWLYGLPSRERQEMPEPPERGRRCWDRPALAELQSRYREAGFELTVIEDYPPLDEARTGGARRDEQIEWFCDQVRAMGDLGIPVLCYSWMAISSWARTATAVELRGGARTTAFDARVAAAEPPLVAEGELTDDDLWRTLEYFLRAVVPVAEEAGVRLALHPDDPPLSPSRGIPRIMRSVEAMQRMVDLVPSPANGITLCQGNFALMTDDLPAVIRQFGSQGKIHFVHMRDVRGTPDNFIETFHDDGPTDLLACFRAYREVGFEGDLRPDHVPSLYGEPAVKPGYDVLGRLFAVGYLKGLREAAYS